MTDQEKYIQKVYQYHSRVYELIAEAELIQASHPVPGYSNWDIIIDKLQQIAWKCAGIVAEERKKDGND